MRNIMILLECLSILAGGYAGYIGEYFLIPIAFCLFIGFVFAEMLFEGREYVDGYEPGRELFNPVIKS